MFINLLKNCIWILCSIVNVVLWEIRCFMYWVIVFKNLNNFIVMIKIIRVYSGVLSVFCVII